ncbi:DUF3556 domain-containing protein [Mycobacterium canetti]|uniref:DUF3556 domain-containing protein n=1 Tax=Mycobacterium canetti TaxID=78331 RepID=UPI0002A559CE|nr:DUF3556 domain-containing protein [Mycobacterium canetti]CCK62660.1 Conserved membrane protein of unknown function [Mycobacterium canettii CIPT 140070017]
MEPIDEPHWRAGTRGDRIRLVSTQVAEHGFGTPGADRVRSLLRIGLYIVGGIGFALTTDGLGVWGGGSDIGTWWREPIVFQKVVLWSLMFDGLGLGCRAGPRLALPDLLYPLRPGTIRLPPLRLPCARGDTQTPVDAALYLLFLTATVFTLLSDGTGPDAGLASAVGVIPVWKVAVVVGLLTLLVLRDKVFFVAAGAGMYGVLTVTFLFPTIDMIVAAKLVMVIIWVGAATAKLHRGFPFVMAIMMSSSPLVRRRRMKRRCYQHFPDDLRPGRLARTIAYTGTFVEFTAPLMLLLSPGVWGERPIVAATALVLLHLAILSAMPVGSPLEWNVFMIFGIFTLFVDKAPIGLGDLEHPVPVAILAGAVVGAVTLGNLIPRRSWFVAPNMRYFAGNANATLWCLAPSAQDKLHTAANLPHERQIYLGYALRALNTNGRALFTLVNRAIPQAHHGEYTIVDGEWICGAAVGLRFADGAMHSEQLVAALQRRCHFEPGEARIVVLDAQPLHRQAQEYRLIDAATGEFERGRVRVADLVSRQPWADDVPVQVSGHHSHSGR